MKSLVSIEFLKLRTTRALFVGVGIAAFLTIASVISNIELAGRSGAPELGSVDNVNKVLSVAALSTMVALAMGIICIAGEYRHRTIMGTFLATPRRGQVLVAKLVTIAVFGAALGAVVFGLALAVAVPMYSNIVGAIIGAVIWVQIVEVAILQPALPSLAKWLPTGAGVAVTSGGSDAANLLDPGVAALVLVAWAAVISVVAARLTMNREVT
jgi:ABC-type transport system involved in multi-copper enzyme maturation permease subunit